LKEAVIFDIQRFSLHDGPGIRTLIFFKGCSLMCEWCANPEGISFGPDLRNDRRRCTKCGKCLQSCAYGAVSIENQNVAIDRTKCRKCGMCVQNCAASALTWWGKKYTVQELYDLARRDEPFYNRSGGGVTLGGGDPLLQNEQAVALLMLYKKNGFNTAIETAGNYPWEYLENAAPYCDTIHFDLKACNSETYERHTQSGGARVFENLLRLDDLMTHMERRPKLILRTVILPGINYTVSGYHELAEFLLQLKCLDRIEILPFHNLGQNKYDQLERAYRFRGKNNLKPEDVSEYKFVLEQVGLPVSISSI